MNDTQFADLYSVLRRIAIALEQIQDNDLGSLTGIELGIQGLLEVAQGNPNNPDGY